MIRLVLCMMAGALFVACGQTGKLYLPDAREGTQGEVVTRPTQTPPEDTGPARSSNSSPSVGAPTAPATPAPEVTAPESVDAAGKKEKKDGAKTPPPDSPPKN